MNWVSLVLITVVITGSLTEFENAGNLCETRSAPETLEKKFVDIENAILELRSRILEKNDVMVQKYESLESSVFNGFSDMEQRMKSEFGEFRTLTQNYDDMSKMLNTILETVTIQNKGISDAIHVQTQKLEHHDASSLKGFEKQEVKLEEASKAASNLKNEISANHSNLMTSLEELDKSTLGNFNKMEGKLQNMADQIQNDSTQYQNFSRAQKLIERTELTLTTLTDRIPQNASKIVETVSNEVQLIGEIVLYEVKLFVTNERYSNVRMVTNLTDYFPPQIFPKNTGIDRATFKCKVHCVKNETCAAFNIIEKQDSFVCEMLPGNMCLNQTRNALLDWPGSTLYEKTNNNTRKSCLEEKFPTGKPIPCEVLRPGCFGDWPQCSNCYKTCKERNRTGVYTLWPEGDGPYTTPLFGYCSRWGTILLERHVNMTTGEAIRNYVMSFHDMHRMNRLEVYSVINFYFHKTNGDFNFIYYKNPIIGTDGTLANIKYGNSRAIADFFQLNGTALKPTPFVNVTDDRYGCGSFWLLDANNATYCPSGQVSMLGGVQKRDGKVISTGMSYPESIGSNDFINRVLITLE